MSKYAKAIVATLGAALVAAQTALPLTPVQHGFVTVAIAALTALSVYLVPNTPEVEFEYRKVGVDEFGQDVYEATPTKNTIRREK